MRAKLSLKLLVFDLGAMQPLVLQIGMFDVTTGDTADPGVRLRGIIVIQPFRVFPRSLAPKEIIDPK